MKISATPSPTENTPSRTPCDDDNECLPIVDEHGTVVGKTSRRAAHSGVDGKPLHPVVHLHLFNLEGELFLQHRPAWKLIQPSRWDTAVGGHVAWGESIAEALCRECREEIGIDISREWAERALLAAQWKSKDNYELNTQTDSFGEETFRLRCAARYLFETQVDRELVFVFIARTTLSPQISEELAGGRFFTTKELLDQRGCNVFTPNFEEEWEAIVRNDVMLQREP